MQIRKMEIGDYDEVYRLWSGTPGMGLRTLDDSFDGIARFLARNPETNFVAEEDRRIVGVILCGHDGRRGFLYHTAVRPDCRKQGVGKSLVFAVLEALSREGINRAALVVYKSNETGNRFWEGLGFVTRDDLVYRNISLNDKNY